MIALEELPHRNVLQILQKMELSTWIRTRLTGSYIFNFVQENSRKFKFQSPFLVVRIVFGNLRLLNLPAEWDFVVNVTNDHIYSYDNVTITDPAVSLAGMIFRTMSFGEIWSKYEDQSDEDFQKYLEKRDDIFNNKVLPTAQLLKKRSHWIHFYNVSEAYIPILFDISGISKMEISFWDIEEEHFCSWIELPELKAVTHMKITKMPDFEIVPSFVSRFEYFEGDLFEEDAKNGHRQDEMNSILLELSKGFSGSRTFILTADQWENRDYEDGRDFKGFHYQTIFSGTAMCVYNCYADYVVNMKVALISEKNFFGILITILRQYEGYETFFEYRLYAAPKIDPEEISIFVMERAFPCYPIDVSILYEKLAKKEDLHDTTKNLLVGYYSSGKQLVVPF